MEIPSQFQVGAQRGIVASLTFARMMALFAIAGGFAVLSGWHFGIPQLRQLAPDLPTMKVNAAVGLILAGTGLMLFSFEATRVAGRVCGFLLAALGGATLSQDVWGWDLGMDQLLFQEPPAMPFTSSAGRMSPTSAISFVLLGGAFLFGQRGRLANLVSDVMLGAVLAQALIVLIGYGYGVIALYYPFPYSAMAVHEVMLFIVVVMGAFAASPERGLAAAVIDPSAGGQMIRRILPGLIVVPVLLGWLRHEGEIAGYFDTAVGTALFAVSTIMLLGGFAWLTAGAIRRADQDRQGALLQLQGQREWLGTTLASIGDAVIATDASGAVQVMNRAAEELSNWELEAARGRPIWEVFRVVDEAKRQPVEDPGLKALRERRTLRSVQHMLLTRDQRPIPVEASAAPIISPTGEVAGAVVTFRDVTDRRRAEQRQTMLVGELNHRVKNVLMIVHSLVHASARHASGTTAEGMAEALTARLHSLSRAHELLLETQWSGASLKAMVERELAPYVREGSKTVSIKGGDVLLPPQCTSVIAMTLHELATNAAKYGALSHPDGKLSVEWRQRGGRLHFAWSERTAKPVAAPKSRTGFGMQLIDRGIRQNLGGETKVQFAKDGLKVTFALPLAQGEAEAPQAPGAGAPAEEPEARPKAVAADSGG